MYSIYAIHKAESIINIIERPDEYHHQILSISGAATFLCMFKAIGHVILLLALLHVFQDAFVAFENAVVATFEAVERNVDRTP
jgi:hypothetical protein